MINTYKIKANEDSCVSSNLQTSANILATFQSHLRKIKACASPEGDYILI